MMHRMTTLAAAAALALAAAPAITASSPQDREQEQSQAGRTLQQPQEPARTTPPQPGQDQQAGRPAEGERAMNDQLFALAAAASGMGEIGVSQLALRKSENDQVRQFAEQMIQDHTQANQQLMQIAEQKGVQLPQGPDLTTTASAMALATCPTETFDQSFFKQQVAAHLLAVGLFKAQSEHGQDPELREFASTTLPKIEQHLQMAMQHAGIQAGPADQPQPDATGAGAEDDDAR